MSELVTENKYLDKVLERVNELKDMVIKDRDYYLKEVEEMGIPDLEQKGYFKKCKELAFKANEKYVALNELEKNTHFGRMDLTLNEDNHTENLVMYIGEKSINKGIENLVYDWRSPVGNLYYMSNQEDYKYKDTIYNLNLKRQIDISNSKINNIYDTFVRGRNLNVTDDFLMKVLNDKKNRNEFVDIIKTIQSNQNSIIRDELNTNSIVQGVAGSGKTVVLLHRLSYLLYNYPEMDRNKLLFITPSTIFKSKLSNINRSLSLTTIKMITMEDYYLEKINYYLPSIKINRVEKDNFKIDMLEFIYSEDYPNYLQSFIKDYTKKSDIKLIMDNIFKDLKNKFNLKNKNYIINKRTTKAFAFTILMLYKLMNFKYYTDYLYMFIDEMQDYGYEEIRLISKMEKNAKLNLYGDVEQAILPFIKKKEINELIDFLNQLRDNVKTYFLNENYRNSKEITNYCNKFLNVTMTPMGINSNPVSEIKVDNYIDYIKNHFDKSHVIIGNDIKDIEELCYIGYEAYTVSQAKGLEFSKVVVMENNFNNVLKYVSYTRTLDKLFILKK
ncbi:MAG: AAA family ATPase [Bacilli bacterium]|nr:AAA family ATPase [Bacilli bacterium]